MSKARELAQATLALISECNPEFGVDAHPRSETVERARKLATDVIYGEGAQFICGFPLEVDESVPPGEIWIKIGVDPITRKPRGYRLKLGERM